MFRNTHTILLSLAGFIFFASPLCGWESEDQYLATLRRADASLFEKSLACKRLAVVGTEAAVPVLAELLEDEKLSHLARYALEPVPSPQVDKAFVASLSTLSGKNLVGVINSIANRGKTEALEPLSKLIAGDDKTVASAAAHAVARLGTPKAAEILEQSMSKGFAAASLVCGKRLAAQGNKEEAVQLLSKTFDHPDAPEHVRLAAMLQLVTIQGADGQDTLASAIQSDNPDTFNMALRVARLLPAAIALPSVVNAIEGTTPARTALLVVLLGDLGESDGLPAVIRAAGSKDPAVRVASLQALSKLGNAVHVPLLVDAAFEGPTAVTEQAHAALAKLPGAEVDKSVLDLLDDPKRRSTAIRVIRQRRIEAAVPRLLSLTGGPDRLEVVAALGETVPLDKMDVLFKLLGADSAELREAAQQAIHAACDRMPDRDATAAELSKFLSADTAEFVMNELRLLGGEKALQVVSDAVEGNDDVLKDHASRALGEWLDITAAPVLLKLARVEGESKYGIRAVKGFIRLARQFSMPETKRMLMCRIALQAASRDSERRLVFEVLRRYPSLEALKVTVEAAKHAALRKDAQRTARAIANKLGPSDEVNKLLNKL